MNSNTRRIDPAVAPMLIGVLCLLAAILRPLLPLPAGVTSERLITVFVVCLAATILTRVADVSLESFSRQLRRKHYFQILAEGLVAVGALVIVGSGAYAVFMGGVYGRDVASSRPVMAALAMIVLGLLIGVLRAGVIAVWKGVAQAQYLLASVQTLVLVCIVGLLSFMEWKLMLRLSR